MTMFIGFTSPNQLLFKYAREWEGRTMLHTKGNLRINARIGDGYSGGGFHPAERTEDFKLTLSKRNEQGVREVVAEGPLNALEWIIPAGSIPTGQYILGATVSALECTLLWSNNGEKIPGPPLLERSLAYMPFVGGWPTNKNYGYVPNKPTRTKQKAPGVPLITGGVFTKRPVHDSSRSDFWSQTLGVQTQDYRGMARKSTTPIGGEFYATVERYSPGGTNFNSPDAWLYNKTDIAQGTGDFSPSESIDGDVSVACRAVIPSAIKHENGDVITLEYSGRIARTRALDRVTETLYGWRRIPGSSQPTWTTQLPPGQARVDWTKNFYEHVPAENNGLTICRAHQMCKDIHDEQIVYVADATNHTVIKIDLRTGEAAVIAGTYGVAGSAEGGVGVAQFNQPRGIQMLWAGQYAGKLIVASEHGCEFFLVDPATGNATSLSKAKRIPTKFFLKQPGDFGGDFSSSAIENRIRWGAPGDLGVVQSFDDAQFTHPCGMAVLSDGKTVVCAHHDELRLYKLDLDARTITTLTNLYSTTGRQDALRFAWPTVHADINNSMGYGIDTLWVCQWHDTGRAVYNSEGVRINVVFTARASSGDSPSIEHDAYGRAMIPFGDGTALFTGDGRNSCALVRKKLPNDPLRDRPRYSQGLAVYDADGPNGRPSLLTMNGAEGHNDIEGYLTPDELAVLSKADRKRYMIETFGVTDWTDEQHDLVAYYLDWQSPVAVQMMRDPNWLATVTDVKPVPEAPPVVIPDTVTNTTPIDSTAHQQLAFDPAMEQVKAGAGTAKRLGRDVTITGEDVAATDWVVP